MKKTLILSSIFAASLALAASTLIGVQGSGAFQDSANGEVTFSMNMKSYRSDSYGSRPATFGTAIFRRSFMMLGNRYTQEFSSAVKGIQKSGSTATFGGPTTLKLFRNGVLDWQTTGSLTGEVRDLTSDGTDSASPDWMSFRFAALDGAPPMAFSGNVTRGDAVVYEQIQK